MRRKIKLRWSRRYYAVAAATVVAGLALGTAASFTDFANLNFGPGRAAIGGENYFNIKVIGTDRYSGRPKPGTWQDADTAEGVDLLVPGAEALVPGGSASTSIPFKNFSTRLIADINFTVREAPGKTSDPLMAEALRYTVSLGDGRVLARNVRQEALRAINIGQYAAGEEGALEIVVTLPDQGSAEANNELQGKLAYPQVHFAAVSQSPE